MALAPERIGIGIRRHFTTAGVHPYDEVEWERRDAAHHQLQGRRRRLRAARRRVPGRLVAERHQHRRPEVLPRHPRHARAGVVAAPGDRPGRRHDHRLGRRRTATSSTTHEAEAFRDELKYLLVTQQAAFNSPVWFNIGVQGRAAAGAAPASSSPSTTRWTRSSTGTARRARSSRAARARASTCRSIRSSASSSSRAAAPRRGPVSFMRGADASAGTIKSGGKTRRAAKMVILNVDHPDIEEFIWCKASEERKARVLRDAGFDMDLDGADSHSIQYQNANNSVRVTDEFMQAVVDDADWHLRAVTDRRGRPDGPGPRPHAPDRRGGVGVRRPRHAVRHHDQPLAHRAQHRPHQRLQPVLGVHAPRQLGVQPGQHQPAEVPRRRRHVRRRGLQGTPSRSMFTAQEILVGNADYPTETIAETSRKFRQLGLGYANLGALLMALGLPYDSDDGRAWAAALTALMTGHAYATSRPHRRPHGPVRRLRRQRASTCCACCACTATRRPTIDEELVPAELLGAAQQAWDEAVRARRASSACATRRPSVLAPTGTIGLMMDCDTTGIEPDLGLVKMKKLVGGGTMSIVNQTIPRALRQPRLHARAGRRDRRLHRRAQVDPRRAAPRGRAPAGVRLLDGRQHDPLHGPRADDGRGAAVHLAARSPRR